jgi:hypothetical protein
VDLQFFPIYLLIVITLPGLYMTIPIITEDRSFKAHLKEFFDGYFYYGSKRYVLIPSHNVNISKIEIVNEPHILSTALKIITLATVIIPLIGLGFLIYNSRLTPPSHVFNENKYIKPVVELPKEKKILFSPYKDNLPFKECLPGLKYGDLKLADWEELIPQYRRYINHDSRFFKEMMELKRDLINWRPGLAERELKITHHFVENQVPELLEIDLAPFIGYDDALIDLLAQRISTMKDIELISKNHHFLKPLIPKISNEDLNLLSTALNSVNLFVLALEYPDKIASALPPFWAMWNTKYERMTLLQYIIYMTPAKSFRSLLESVPKSLPKDELKDIAAHFKNMVRRDIALTPEQAKIMVEEKFKDIT